MRDFTRHLTTVPIYITAMARGGIREGLACEPCEMTNVSDGGIAFEVALPIEVGSLVAVDIPSVSPQYRGEGKVVWCRAKGEQYEVGLKFVNTQEAYKSRMVQQICQIEEYRHQVFEREGRMLNSDQAAMEWIEKNAENFP